MSGDVSPHRTIVLEFDSIERRGEPMPIETVVTNSVARVKRQVARDAAEDDQTDGVVARAKHKARETAEDAVSSAKQRAADAIAAVKEPGTPARLTVWAVHLSPSHPLFRRKGPVFDAGPRPPRACGIAPPHPAAPEGTMPAPSSVLHARLATTLDSSKAERG